MPRCFLAKKSSTFDSGSVKWDTNSEPDENENCSTSMSQTRDIHHRSTVGSISAAQAVRSIQEPIGMPPSAYIPQARTLKDLMTNQTISASVLNPQISTKTISPEPRQSDEKKLEIIPVKVEPAVNSSNSNLCRDEKHKKCNPKVSKLQERRKKQQEQNELQSKAETVIQNLTNGENVNVRINPHLQQMSVQPVTSNKQNDHGPAMGHQQLNGLNPPLQLSITLPPPMKKIKLEPMTYSNLSPPIHTTPLPPEILANIKPHPPSSFSPPSSLNSSPSPPHLPIHPVLPMYPLPVSTSRIHTKEETDAAHDLLELSRSLPPIQGPPPVTIQAVHPPLTPPSPPEDKHYTLIYITSPSPYQTENGYGSSQYTNTEYPLTPPEQSTDSNMYPPMGAFLGSPVMQPSPQLSSDCDDDESQLEIAASDLTLSIVDGRTKKSKHGIQVYSKDKSKYTCSECGKNYATSSNLSRHKQTHRSLDSGSAKKCHICGKMYVSMPALSMHILTHNLNHKCHVCGKAFSRPWLLQGHLRSHTGQKPYLCTVCKKCFADRSNLRAHMQTHSPAKNFQCSKCKKTFALKSYLNKHYESSCVRGEDSPSPNLQESYTILS